MPRGVRVRPEDLERDVTRELRVARAVHPAHRALAQQRPELEAPEHRRQLVLGSGRAWTRSAREGRDQVLAARASVQVRVDALPRVRRQLPLEQRQQRQVVRTRAHPRNVARALLGNKLHALSTHVARERRAFSAYAPGR